MHWTAGWTSLVKWIVKWTKNFIFDTSLFLLLIKVKKQEGALSERTVQDWFGSNMIISTSTMLFVLQNQSLFDLD